MAQGLHYYATIMPTLGLELSLISSSANYLNLLGIIQQYQNDTSQSGTMQELCQSCNQRHLVQFRHLARKLQSYLYPTLIQSIASRLLT